MEKVRQLIHKDPRTTNTRHPSSFVFPRLPSCAFVFFVDGLFGECRKSLSTKDTKGHQEDRDHSSFLLLLPSCAFVCFVDRIFADGPWTALNTRPTGRHPTDQAGVKRGSYAL